MLGAVYRIVRIFPEIKWVSVKINRGVRFNLAVVGSCEQCWIKVDNIESSFQPLPQEVYSIDDLMTWRLRIGIYFSNHWPFVVSTVGNIFE
jgi:hypothetical protein